MRKKKLEKKKLLGIILIATVLFSIPCLCLETKAAEVVVYNANEWDVFKNRSQKEIANEYNKAKNAGATYKDGVTTSYYKTSPSAVAPYSGGELTEDTHLAMTAMTNYYRWLVGSKPIGVSSHSADLQVGALVRIWNHNHIINDTQGKPADMSETLWNQGAKASNNILAWGYTPTGSITGWLDEGYDLRNATFDTVGHRYFIISDSVSSLQFAYVSSSQNSFWGYSSLGKGTTGANKTLAYTAYPSPGYMPLNDLPVETSAWTVEVNKNEMSYSLDNLKVVVTNLNTKETYECTKANGKLTENFYNLAFVQPSASGSHYTEGDQYKVEITGLIDKKTNNAAKIEYQTKFFDINDAKDEQESEKSIVSVIATPKKNTYKVGENFNVTGSNLLITYKDGKTSTIALTEDMISGFSSSTKGITTVTVNYDGQTTTFDCLIVGNPSNIEVHYGVTLGDINLPVDTYGVYSFKDPSSTLVGSVGNHTFSLLYTPKNSKYATADDLAITINVVPKEPSYIVPDKLEATYGDTLANITLPSSTEGRFEWEDLPITSVGNVGEKVINIKFVPIDTVNYKTIEHIPVKLVVKKKQAPIVVIPTLGEITYDAGVTLANITLPNGWSWDNPNQVPTVGNSGYFATYTPVDTMNYDYSAQNLNPTLTLKVKKATPIYTAPTLVAYKDNKLKDVELPKLSNGTFSWQDNIETLVGDTGTHTFQVTFTPNDTNNYETVTDIIATVEVGKTKPSYTIPKGLTATYQDKLSTISLPTGFTWNDPNSLVGNAGMNTFLATYTPDDTNNYAVVNNIEISVKVNKKLANPVILPTLNEITYQEGFTLANITLPNGWSWDNPNQVPTVGNSGYLATYTPADTINYDYSAQNLHPSLVISVKKANPIYTIPTNVIAHWKDDLSNVSLPEGFRFQDTGDVGELGTKEYMVTYTPKDTVNYHTIKDIKITVKVVKAIPPVEKIKDIILKSSDQKITLLDIALPEGWVWENPDLEVTKSGKYKAIYIPKDPDHYETVELDVTVTFPRDIEANVEFNGVPKEDIIPPNTGDNILSFFVIFILSILSIAKTSYELKKINK